MRPRSPQAGFSLTELIVVISIIAVLASLTFPVMQHISEKGKATKCLSNMRQIGIGFLMFAQESDGKLPNRVDNGEKWPALTNQHIKTPKVFACPTDQKSWDRLGVDPISNTGNNTSYIFNGFNDVGSFEDREQHLKLVGIEKPSETVLLGEHLSGDHNFYMDFFEGNHLVLLEKERHGEAANYVFCDGSVRRITKQDYKDELWLVDKEVQLPN